MNDIKRTKRRFCSVLFDQSKSFDSLFERNTPQLPVPKISELTRDLFTYILKDKILPWLNGSKLKKRAIKSWFTKKLKNFILVNPLPSKLLENYAVKARIRLKASMENGGSSRHGSHASRQCSRKCRPTWDLQRQKIAV